MIMRYLVTIKRLRRQADFTPTLRVGALDRAVSPSQDDKGRDLARPGQVQPLVARAQLPADTHLRK